MRLLPWRKLDPNPWGETDYLSGWVPGTAPALDLFALIASIARSQYSLAVAQSRLARAYAIMSILWALVAIQNLLYVFHWWK